MNAQTPCCSQDLSLQPSSNPLSPAISIENLTIQYDAHIALKEATLSVKTGELLAVVGPSGCGKSSMLHAINRLTDLTHNCNVNGRIVIDNNDVLAPQTNVIALRRKVGLVFQQPNPFPMSIWENLAFPLREHGIKRKCDIEQKITSAFIATGLWNEVKDRLFEPALSLSGGQQQRLCIARTLVLAPKILLLDEPCSALDPISARKIEELILSLKGHYTIMMVTHNLLQARRMADGVAVCWVNQGCGCVIETGVTDTVFNNPASKVTAEYCARGIS